MRRQKLLLATLIVAMTAGGAVQAQNAAPAESKDHEMACTVATTGGAVAGVALGSLLGGGLGRTLFMTAGCVAGGMLGHAMRCPQKS